MATKITLQIDNQTHTGFVELVNDLRDADRAADAAEDAASALGDELTDGDMKKAAAQIKDLTERLEQMEKQAKETASAADRATGGGDGGGEGWGSRVTGTVAAVWAISEAFKKGGEWAVYMADQGSEGMAEIVAAGREAQQALLDLVNDPDVRDGITWMGKFTREQIVPSIAAIPTAWRSAGDAIEDTIASMGEAVGLFAEGTTAALDDMQEHSAKVLEERRKQMEAQKQEMKIQKQQEDLVRAMTGMEQARAEAKRLQAYEEQRNLRAVNSELQQLETYLKSLADEGELTAEAQNKGLAKLQQLQTLRQRIIDADINDRKMAEEQAATKREQREVETAARIADAEAALVEKRKAAQEKALAEARKIREEMKKLFEEDNGEGSAIDKLRQNFTQNDVLNQARTNRIDDAKQQAMADFEAQGGEIGTNGKAMGGAGEQAKLAKMLKQAQMQASRQFAQDAKRGELDQKEILEAQQSLTQSVLNQVKSNGNLSKAQIDGLQMAANASNEAADQAIENKRMIEQIQEQLGNTTDKLRTSRQRAQRSALR